MKTSPSKLIVYESTPYNSRSYAWPVCFSFPQHTKHLMTNFEGYCLNLCCFYAIGGITRCTEHWQFVLQVHHLQRGIGTSQASWHSYHQPDNFYGGWLFFFFFSFYSVRINSPPAVPHSKHSEKWIPFEQKVWTFLRTLNSFSKHRALKLFPMIPINKSLFAQYHEENESDILTTVARLHRIYIYIYVYTYICIYIIMIYIIIYIIIIIISQLEMRKQFRIKYNLEVKDSVEYGSVWRMFKSYERFSLIILYYYRNFSLRHISVMTSQITGNSTVRPTAYSG